MLKDEMRLSKKDFEEMSLKFAESSFPTLRTLNLALISFFEKNGMGGTAAVVLLNLLFCPERSEPSVLAAEAGVPRQTMTSVIDLLERRGYLLRMDHISDRRKKCLVLTDSGRVRALELGGGLLEFERDILSVLSEEERVSFHDIVRKLNMKLESIFGRR